MLATDDWRLATPTLGRAVQFNTSVMGWADAGGWVSTRNRLPSGADVERGSQGEHISQSRTGSRVSHLELTRARVHFHSIEMGIVPDVVDLFSIASPYRKEFHPLA